MHLFRTVAKAALELIADVDKRKNGVFVSRPILNAKAWHDWAVRHGVPNPVPPEEMHVTVIYSEIDTLMIPDQMPKSVSTIGSYYPGQFALFGPDENVLVFAFDDWELHDRYYAYQRNGAVSKWPTYRPHMTLTYDIGEYELPDEALIDAPTAIIMGGEVRADIKDAKITPDESDPEGDGDSPDLIIVIDIVRAAAQKHLETEKNLNPMELGGLRDLMHAESVTKSLAERMAKSPWASDDLKKLFAEATTKKSREVFFNIAPIPVDVAKKLNGALVRKSGNAERMLIGIANMTTVKGQLVVDSDKDTFTTQAVTEWMRDIIRSHRSVDFDHVGEASMELVQGFVLSEDVQKALNFDLGFEPALVEVHIADDEGWAKAEKGDWMFSIAGTFYYEEASNG